MSLLSFLRIGGLGLACGFCADAAELIPVASLVPSGPVEGGGVAVALELGAKRTGWTNARWSVARLAGPIDLSRSGGLRVRAGIAAPRRDVELSVAILEEDGSWYVCPGVIELTAGENAGVAHFRDFGPADFIAPPKADPASKEGWFDENGRLDCESIIAVAIGCVDAGGAGTVAFTVAGIEPVGSPEPPAAPVEVVVSGRALDVNGTTMVPAGLFGSFNLPKGHTGRYRLAQDRRIHHSGLAGGPEYGDGVTHMMVNTIGDRVRPSPRLTAADWEARLRAYGESFGAAAKAAATRGNRTYVEFWNEPYLNWANRNRANFNPAFYDESKAKEGGEVRIRHDGQVAPHLRWTRDFHAPPWNWCGMDEWRRGRDASGKVRSAFAPPYKGMEAVYGGPWQPATFPPRDIPDGATYRVPDRKGGDIELTAFTPWHIYDDTQFSYWSGKGMLKLYLEPMLAFAQAVKRQHPETVFIAGWGNRPSEDHWAGFTQLYQQTIDRGAAVIDGVCDHDYGGSPFRMAANYEFITAYGMARHGKWLHGYNTETAMGGDPQAYPDAEVAKGVLADRQKCRWTLAKLIHALAVVPDKARSFSWFGYGGGWFSDGGEGVALDLLINLRGRLMEVASSDPEVIAVAAIDGTDPENPRPDPMGRGRELVTALFNAGRTPRTISLATPSPGRPGAMGLLRIVRLEGPRGGPSIEDQRVRGEGQALQVVLGPGEAATLTQPLQGTGIPEAGGEPNHEVRRRQYFADTFLREVTPVAPAECAIAADPKVTAGAARAWVRVVVERLGEGEGVLVFNGGEIPMPAAVTPENTPCIRDIPIEPALLRESNTLAFKVPDPARRGFLLASASLMVESR